MAILGSRDRVMRRLTEQAAKDAIRNEKVPTKSRAKAATVRWRPTEFADDIQGSPAVPVLITISAPVKRLTVTGDTRFKMESLILAEAEDAPTDGSTSSDPAPAAILGKTSFAVEEIDVTGAFVRLSTASASDAGDNGETVETG